MCLAIPAQIAAISEDGQTATCLISGIEKSVNISLIENAQVGEWVIVHVGFALNRIDEAQAQATLAVLAQGGGDRTPDMMTLAEARS